MFVYAFVQREQKLGVSVCNLLLCLLQVEVEEEFLTNTLQKKLEKVGCDMQLLPCQHKQHRMLQAVFIVIPSSADVPDQPATTCAVNFYVCFLGSVRRGCVLKITCSYVHPSCLQLNKEKVDLENRLEAEQEYVVNKLCKQVGTAYLALLL
jgi:hypothetical protein